MDFSAPDIVKRSTTLAGILVVLLLFPSLAFACECAARGGPSEQFRKPYIFVGKVLGTEISGQGFEQTITNGRPTLRTVPGTSTLRISVERQFRGAPIPEIRISRPGLSFSDCDYSFVDGAFYLLFDDKGDGASFSICEPPIPVADVPEAMKYVDAILANRQQAFLYGYLTQLRIDSRSGQMTRFTPATPVTVVVDDGKGTPIRKTVQGSQYQIVVAPGQYRVWLEFEGKPISSVRNLRVSGQDLRSDFEYQLPK